NDVGSPIEAEETIAGPNIDRFVVDPNGRESPPFAGEATGIPVLPVAREHGFDAISRGRIVEKPPQNASGDAFDSRLQILSHEYRNVDEQLRQTAGRQVAANAFRRGNPVRRLRRDRAGNAGNRMNQAPISM